MEKFIVSLIAFILSIPVTLLGAYIFSDLWQWFVVPAFGIPQISMALAFGLLVVLGFLRTGATLNFMNLNDKLKKLGDEDTESLIEPLVNVLIVCVAYLVSWGLGAIVHQFV